MRTTMHVASGALIGMFPTMNTRTFTAFTLVQLPRLDANSAYSLGIEVLAVAKKAKLPEAAAEALAEVKHTHAVLFGTLRETTLDATLAEQPDAKAATSELSSRWNAFYNL